MTSSNYSKIYYRECSGIVRIAGGDILQIEGVVIVLRFRSNSYAFDVQLSNAAFVSRLSHNLLSR